MEQEHYVEKVVKSQEVGIGRDREVEFLVRWHGDWPPDEKETWEPASSIVARVYLTCIKCGKQRLAQREGRTTCRGINRTCGEPNDSFAFTPAAVAAGERRVALEASIAAKKSKKVKSRVIGRSAPPPENSLKGSGLPRQLVPLGCFVQSKSAKMKFELSDQGTTREARLRSPSSSKPETSASTGRPGFSTLLQVANQMTVGRGAAARLSDLPATPAVPVGAAGQAAVDKHPTPKEYRGQGGEKLYGPGPNTPKQGRAGTMVITAGRWLQDRTISVWWWAEKKHFMGTVAEWDASDDTVRIEYNDGDVHWHDLHEFEWSLVGSTPPQSAVIQEADASPAAVGRLPSAASLGIGGTAPPAGREKARGARAGKDGTDDGGHELCIGSRVTVEGYSSAGVVAFLGAHAYGKGPRCGIVLDDPIGKNNGTASGHTYFVCEPSHGLLVVPRKVTIVSPEPEPKARGPAPTKANPAGKAAAALPTKRPETAEKATGKATDWAAPAEAHDGFFACGACPKQFLRRSQLIKHFEVHLRELDENAASDAKFTPSPEPEPELSPEPEPGLAPARASRSTVRICLENEETGERLDLLTSEHAAEFLGVSAQRLALAFEREESVNGYRPFSRGRHGAVGAAPKSPKASQRSPQTKPRSAPTNTEDRNTSLNPHGCSECSKRFRRADQLMRHLENVHNIKVEDRIVTGKRGPRPFTNHAEQANAAKKPRSNAAAPPTSKSHGTGNSRSAKAKNKTEAKHIARYNPTSAMFQQDIPNKPAPVFSGTRMVKAPKKFDPGMMENAMNWIDRGSADLD